MGGLNENIKIMGGAQTDRHAEIWIYLLVAKFDENCRVGLE